MSFKNLMTKKYVKKRHARQQCTIANWEFVFFMAAKDMTKFSGQFSGQELVLIAVIKCRDLVADGRHSMCEQ